MKLEEFAFEFKANGGVKLEDGALADALVKDERLKEVKIEMAVQKFRDRIKAAVEGEERNSSVESEAYADIKFESKVDGSIEDAVQQFLVEKIKQDTGGESKTQINIETEDVSMTGVKAAVNGS